MYISKQYVKIEDAPDACLAILYALEWFQVNSNHKPRETRLKKPLPGRNKVSFRKIARYFEKLIVDAAKIWQFCKIINVVIHDMIIYCIQVALLYTLLKYSGNWNAGIWFSLWAWFLKLKTTLKHQIRGKRNHK